MIDKLESNNCNNIDIKNINSNLNDLLELALLEDLGLPYTDITTKTLLSHLRLDQKLEATARIISKHHEPIVICGLSLVDQLLKKIDDNCRMHTCFRDSQVLNPGSTLLTLSGSPHTLLMLERTLLNFLQRLCAIASLTAKYVAAIKQTSMKILDTRKTTPGMRHLEKYAVHCGGGVNHRIGLYDAIMIKDTHIDFLGGIDNAINQLPDNITATYPVIVEVRNKHELTIVLTKGLHKVTRVLLDNMCPELLAECVALCHGKVATEASGNINLDNILSVARSGVDFASIGKLTHSAGSVDLSMKCDI